MHSLFDPMQFQLWDLPHFRFADVLGFIGVLFYLPSYYMKTIIPLRVMALIGDSFLIAYGYFSPSFMTLVLGGLILPLNALPLP